MIKIRWSTLVLSIFLIAVFAAFLKPIDVMAQKKKTKKQQIASISETLKPNQVWISSIPVGLECAVYKDTSSKGKGQDQSKKDTGSVEIAKGTTPMIIDLEPGLYHAQCIGNQKDEGEGDAAHWNMVCDDKIAGYEMKLLGNSIAFLPVFDYSFEKKPDTAMTLIALAQPILHRTNKYEFLLNNIDSLIAKGVIFKFDEAAVKKVLLEKGTPEKMVVQALPLLKRAGKLVLAPEVGAFYSIEIIGVNRWEIKDVLEFPYMRRK
jgi:hypothetical protein